jgi:adenylate cyclase, class 2
MIEVELKYRLEEPESLATALVARGSSPRGETTERDLYFNHPARDFATTDEALRLRWDGQHAVCTYKGRLLDQLSKSREELEATLADETALETMRQILDRLGFRFVREVVKRRTKWPLVVSGLPVLVTVDNVAGLGLFAELETSADASQYAAARDQLIQLAASLGLTQSERRSYLQLLLES